MFLCTCTEVDIGLHNDGIWAVILCAVRKFGIFLNWNVILLLGTSVAQTIEGIVVGFSIFAWTSSP